MNKKNNATSEKTFDKGTTSVVLNLETLTVKYDNLLKEYNQVQSDYINYLNETSEGKTPSDDVLFKTVTGKAFWGTEKATTTDTTSAKNLSECRALCANDKNCTGATFNSMTYGKPMCWLRKGDGDLVDATKNDTAIVSQKMIFLKRMKTLNTQLQKINKEISILIAEKGDKIYKDQLKNRSQKTSILHQNKMQLHSQQDKIESQINEYESITNEQNEESLKLKQNYTIYGIMLVVAIIAFILLVKFSSSGEENNSYIPAPVFQRGGDLSTRTYYGVFLLIFFAVMIQSFYNYN